MTVPTWCVHQGDCLEVLPTLPKDAAIVSDPPYGMAWNTDSTRFSGGARRRGDGRRDIPPIAGDRAPFDPSPWLAFQRVLLFGANHFARLLPVGTTLVWVKRAPKSYGTFLSDAEIAWMKGGHGVYCWEQPFNPPQRAREAAVNGTSPAHPTQKPVDLMRWCIQRLKLKPGTLIVDPFCGSGSTGVAALREGFDFLGIEIDPTYADRARRRLAAEASQTCMFAVADK